MLLCLLGGGSAREDTLSLIYLRPAAVASIAVFLLLPGETDVRRYRVLLIMLAVLALSMLVQLVPIPPDLWASSAQRSVLMPALRQAGVEGVWRPLSLSPDLTLNALLSLVVPLAVLVGMSSLGHPSRRLVALALAAMTGVTLLAGTLQAAGASIYPYRVTNEGMPVGLFANRNHQALFLAAGIPLISHLLIFTEERRRRKGLAILAAGFAGFALVMLLITGSRAGLVLGALALVATVLSLARPRFRRALPFSSRAVRLFAITAAAAATGIVLLFVFSARSQSIQRLLSVDTSKEQRFADLPELLKMALDYLPWGSGFGTFDRAYRIREAMDELATTYLNHAHNDVLEMLITGGLPAIVALLMFGAFLLKSGALIGRWRADASPIRALASAGLIIVLLQLTASLVDYPIRVPLTMLEMTLACCWLTDGLREESRLTRNGFTQSGKPAMRAAG